MIPVALKRRNVMNTLNTGTEGPQKVIERYNGTTCTDSYGIGRHKYCTLYRVTVAVQILYIQRDCDDTDTVHCTLYRVTVAVQILSRKTDIDSYRETQWHKYKATVSEQTL